MGTGTSFYSKRTENITTPTFMKRTVNEQLFKTRKLMFSSAKDGTDMHPTASEVCMCTPPPFSGSACLRCRRVLGKCNPPSLGQRAHNQLATAIRSLCNEGSRENWIKGYKKKRWSGKTEENILTGIKAYIQNPSRVLVL